MKVELLKKFFIDNVFAIKTIVTTIGICYFMHISPMASLFPWLILVLVGIFYKNISPEINKFSKLCAGIFALCLTLGEPNLFLTTKANIGKILCIFLGSYFFLSYLCQIIFDKYEIVKCNPSKCFSKKIFLYIFGGLLICWLPYWLAFYPAVLTPDSIAQISQFLGVSKLLNHHPIAHTMTIKAVFMLGRELGFEEINQTIGFVSAVQLLFMAACFTFVVRKVYLVTGKISYAAMSFAFYAFLSFHAYYSVTIWKDITHGAIAVIFLLLLTKLLYSDKRDCKIYLLIFIASVAFCLFRSNGYYALILWLIPLGYFVYRKRKYKLIVVVASAIIASTIIKGPVYGSLGILEDNYSEKLSIPLQQVAYVIKNKKPLTEEQNYYLNQIIDVNKVPTWYLPWISDPIKGRCGNRDFFEANKFQYFKIWLQLGMKYPKDYIIAYLNQTRGYWYPNVKYWVYGKGVMKNDLGLESRPIKFKHFLLKQDMQKWPLIGIFYNVGIYTWVLIFMFLYSVYKRYNESALIYTLFLGILGSLLLATPVFSEFRYYYSVVAALPLLVILPLENKRFISK